MIYIQATVDVILSNTEIEKEPLSSGGQGGLGTRALSEKA